MTLKKLAIEFVAKNSRRAKKFVVLKENTMWTCGCPRCAGVAGDRRWQVGTYHGELLAEDVVAERRDEVEQEVAAGDVAVDVQRHGALHLLPLGHHLVPLQAVVPALQLRGVDGVRHRQRQPRRHVAVGERVGPGQLPRVLLLVHPHEQHLELGRLEDGRTEQPRPRHDVSPPAAEHEYFPGARPGEPRAPLLLQLLEVRDGEQGHGGGGGHVC